MHPLAEVALINAVMATILGLLAAVVGWWFRRPALTHVLWLLVLIKLITPPVWRLPMLDRDWVSRPLAALEVMLDASFVDPTPLPVPVMATGSDDPEPAVARVRPKVLPTTHAKPVWWPRIWMRQVLDRLRSDHGRKMMTTALLTAWGLGTVTWFAVQALRCSRFQQAMRLGRAAPPELQDQLVQLAVRCGCSQIPQLWLMPGAISPMLWSAGRSTRLIYPEALLARLDAVSRETLLAHELAHYQRGDHWVRFVSLFATGLFWWHPVVWWARHSLEAAEEECCDAWVVTRGAAPPRRYAEAILETVDFLAERRWRAPPLATGLGQLPFLRQRLIWIMRGPRRQDFTRAGRIICMALAVSLPLQPTWLVARPASPTMLLPNADNFQSELTVADQANSSPLSVDWLSQDDLAWLQVHGFSRGPAGEKTVASADRRFVVFLGPSRQWMIDRTLERMVDLSSHRLHLASFAADGTSLVTGGLDGVVRLWNAEAFSEVAAWSFSSGPLSALAISPDATWIASGGKDGLVRVWRAETPDQASSELSREPSHVSSLRFSPDGRSLAVSTGDASNAAAGRIAIWNLADQTERTSMNWNQATATLAYGRDGRSLVSGDWRGRIARWNPDTGELLGFLEGQQTLIDSALASSDGTPLSEVRVPELPLHFLVGDASQDEQVKSLWDQLTRRASFFTKPHSDQKPTQTVP